MTANTQQPSRWPRTRYEWQGFTSAPRVTAMRRRHPDLDPIGRAMLEEHRYRPSMFDFMGATGANPHILTDAALTSHDVVIDAGAFVGDWAAAMIDRHPCTIVAYEPGPTFSTLQDRFERIPRVDCRPYGLGAADEVVTMALAGPGSSTVSARDAAFGNVDVELRDAATEFGALTVHGRLVEEIALLKVNIEGGEYDLFDRLIETGWLSRIHTLSIQFHEWVPGAHRRRTQLHRAFAHTHVQAWDYPWVWELWTRRR